MKVEESLLTTEDIVYLDKFKKWVRSSLEFIVLGKIPSEDDLVYLQNDNPINLKEKNSDKFLTLGEISQICEKSASHNLVYEAWLSEVLNNAYRVANSLNDDDCERLIVFIKINHGVEGKGEGELIDDAYEAIRDAHRALYG